MFTEPKRGNGLNESELSYATKRLWAIVCYYEIYKPPTFENFIKNIQKYITKYEFDWPKPKPGKDKYPKYDTAKEWPSKYDYKSCVQCFENYQLNIDKKEVDLIHDKKYPQDTKSDFKNYDAYDEEIRKELAKDEPDFKKIELLENLKDKVWNRNNKRSGRDVKKIEGNINSKIKAAIDLNNDLTAEELREKDEAYIRQFIEG